MSSMQWCWHWIGSTSIGQWFLEVDRVLRPGGFFVFYANTIWGNHNVKDQVLWYPGIVVPGRWGRCLGIICSCWCSVVGAYEMSCPG
jgi:hypothetical protein